MSIDLRRGGEQAFTLKLNMPVREIYCNPAVHENQGRVAIARGPLIYCLEQAGNTAPIRSARIAEEPDYSVQRGEEPLRGIGTIEFDGEASCIDYAESPLYSDTPYRTKPHRFTAIPYYAWANREPGDMSVWIAKTHKHTED